MFSQAFVCPHGDGWGWYSPLNPLIRGTWDTTGYSWQVSSTHPTMHAFLLEMNITAVNILTLVCFSVTSKYCLQASWFLTYLPGWTTWNFRKKIGHFPKCVSRVEILSEIWLILSKINKKLIETFNVLLWHLFGCQQQLITWIKCLANSLLKNDAWSLWKPSPRERSSIDD